MRGLSLLLLVLALGAASPILATQTKPTPTPTIPTLDCNKDNNAKTCAECGGGGLIACCYDECDVINKPKKIYLNPLPPVGPIQPWPGSSWELL